MTIDNLIFFSGAVYILLSSAVLFLWARSARKAFIARNLASNLIYEIELEKGLIHESADKEAQNLEFALEKICTIQSSANEHDLHYAAIALASAHLVRHKHRLSDEFFQARVNSLDPTSLAYIKSRIEEIYNPDELKTILQRSASGINVNKLKGLSSHLRFNIAEILGMEHVKRRPIL